MIINSILIFIYSFLLWELIIFLFLDKDYLIRYGVNHFNIIIYLDGAQILNKFTSLISSIIHKNNL